MQRKKKKSLNADKSDATNSGQSVEDSQKDSPKPPTRRPLFEYPPIPAWETRINFLAMISVVVYVWYLVFQATRNYESRGGWGVRRYVKSRIFGEVLRDRTNYEWNEFQPILVIQFAALCGHSIIFNVSHALVGSRKYIAEILNFLYALAACAYIFQFRIILVSCGEGLIIFAFAKLALFAKNNLSPKVASWIPLRLLIWLPAAPILYVNLEYPYLLMGDADFFSSLLFSSYKILQYIGFGLEMYSGKKFPPHRNALSELWSMFRFAFYLPYLISVIVLYPDYLRQMEERQRKPRQWKAAFILAARILFYYCFVELILLNFFHFEAILGDLRTLRLVDEATLVSLGYATGQFFHLKYVIIFGMPCVFAKLDKMDPPQGPICISRVALYSKMWRSFDRGLYNFFKEYIFIPICQPTFSLPRKVFGLCLSFLFVVLWHGFTHQYIVWIAINFFELLLETISKAVYSIEGVKSFRERHLSDTKFRRILAWLQIIPFSFALYSTFYFIAGDQAGYVFVERIFWGETVTLQYPFFVLIAVGYFYCNCCMDCERWFGTNQIGKQKVA